MKSGSLIETILELKDNFQKYLETNISYYGLSTLEKVAKVVNYIISHTVVMVIFAISLIFLSGAAAIYIGKLMQSYELGLLIVGGSYTLIGIVLYLFRNRIFGRSVIRALLKILLHKEE